MLPTVVTLYHLERENRSRQPNYSTQLILEVLKGQRKGKKKKANCLARCLEEDRAECDRLLRRCYGPSLLGQSSKGPFRHTQLCT